MGYLTWPNRISLLRLFLIGPFVVMILHLNDDAGQWFRRAALGIFALMAISDGLDGYLARKYHQESPLGKFLDPLADKVVVVCTVILLGIDAFAVRGFQIPDWMIVAAIGKDLLVVVGFVLVFFLTHKVLIRPSPVGKVCTALQLCMVVFVLCVPDLNSWVLAPLIGAERAHSWLYGAVFALWVSSAALAVAAAIDYARIGAGFVARHGELPAVAEDHTSEDPRQ